MRTEKLLNFWVPAEAEDKVTEFKQQRTKAEEARRAELMQKLTGNRKPATGVRKPTEPQQEEEKEERPMRKIKVWRDDPTSPVKTLPDVVSDMV